MSAVSPHVISIVVLFLVNMTEPFRKTYFIFILSVVALFFAPNIAFACSCFDLSSLGKTEKQLIKIERKKSQAVFAGEVTKVIIDKNASGANSGIVEIHFKVLQAWKGVTTKTINIFTTNILDICGYEFKVGELYLVYAYTFSSDNRLNTTICTRTNILSEATEDLKVLGKGKDLKR